jgi:hypothetical protein
MKAKQGNGYRYKPRRYGRYEPRRYGRYKRRRSVDTIHEDTVDTNDENTVDTNQEDAGFVVGLAVSSISGNDYMQPETDITLSLYRSVMFERVIN